MKYELDQDEINQVFWDMAAAVLTIENLIDRDDEESRILIRKNMLFIKLCLTKKAIREQIPDLAVFESVLCCSEFDVDPRVKNFVKDWADDA